MALSYKSRPLERLPEILARSSTRSIMRTRCNVDGMIPLALQKNNGQHISDGAHLLERPCSVYIKTGRCKMDGPVIWWTVERMLSVHIICALTTNIQACRGNCSSTTTIFARYGIVGTPVA